ncbi:LPD7 domain-containing protein [Sphingomonas sp. CARO-RG-8B-R24-01]|uniref:LPD7 domain-containing protein n=1 Tax=Sphingomonas sp. CARO-RG-8B-R24-01 TaxID=2914831 RepID=UPI001F55F595|nr:LPD7 domain-containing protein [Sphingomonas sp. CARO-RG-8B-R24-01]
MADVDGGAAGTLREQSAGLSEGDRGLLLTLSQHTASHKALYEDLNDGLDAFQRELHYEKIDVNQDRLNEALESVLKSPSLSSAFTKAGYDPDELRSLGEDGAWDSDVADAVYFVRSGLNRHEVAARQEAVSQQVTAMEQAGVDQRPSMADRLVTEFEGQVRADIAGRDRVDESEVASRLADRVEQLIAMAPEPIAEQLRQALVRRAFEAELDADGAPVPRDRLGSELGMILAGDDEDGRSPIPTRVRRAERDLELAEDARGHQDIRQHEGSNRIEAPDGASSEQSAEQVREFVELTAEPASRAAEAHGVGFLGLLRGMLRPGDTETVVTALAADDDSTIPEALRRRYGVHVSDNQKKIELFERGAKIAAITLDARSISTSHNEGVVIADIVALARDRGWQTLKVDGTAEFKDAVWLEANKVGLAVNHHPSSATQATYEKWDRERPDNKVQQAPGAQAEGVPRPARQDLASLFAEKNPEDRLADPRLRNAQLELMIGILTAEKELGKTIGEMPDVQRALTAAVGQQLANGKVFDPPFVKPEQTRPAARQVVNPTIKADTIPAPRQ